MKLTIPLLLILFLFSMENAASQVTIGEGFLIGDTTQTHKITTLRGDVFKGRIIEMDQSKIKFIFGDNELIINLAEIERIEVFSENELPDQGKKPVKLAFNNVWRFDYEIKTKDGAYVVGEFSKFTKYGVYIKVDGKKMQQVHLEDIDSMIHLGNSFSPNPDILIEYHLLTSFDNSNFIGALVSIADGKANFMLKNGSMITFNLNHIKVITVENNTDKFGLVGSDIRADFSDNQQRVFYTPSAFLLKKGVREFRTMVLFNNFDYGASNNLTIGTGLFSVIVATAVTGKVKIGASLTDNVHVAIGGQGMVAFSAYDSDNISMGLFYGALSIGNSKNHLSLAAGRGKASDDRNGSFGFSAGTSLTLNQHWRFNIEYFQLEQNNSYYYNDDNYLVGNIGASWLKYGNQIDFGIMLTTLWDTDLIGFPVFGYSYKF